MVQKFYPNIVYENIVLVDKAPQIWDSTQDILTEVNKDLTGPKFTNNASVAI